MILQLHANPHVMAQPDRDRVSILNGKSLDGASFRSVDELKAHIASYNEDARPFHWTKSKVHQRLLKPCFAVQ